MRADPPTHFAGRIGSWLFLAAGILTIVNNFIPPLDGVNRPALFAIGAGALVCGVLAARMRWERWPARATLVMPVAALVLITSADLYGGVSAYSYAVYYVVAFAFIGMTQPPRTALALAPVALVCYVLPPLARPSIPAAAALSATVAIPVCVLIGEVISRVMWRLWQAQDQSEHRATLLGHVARTHRTVSTLDTDEVLASVVDATLGLGFEAAEMCMFDEDAGVWRPAHPRNLPATYVGTPAPIDSGIAGRVHEEGATVVINDYSAFPSAAPQLRDEGYRLVVATPVWSQGELVAALIAGTRVRQQFDDEDVEAFELLAAQAGRALENARRFEEERRTVEKLAELDRMKEDFVATVSHELRTPLAVIKGLGLTVDARWDELDAETRRELVKRMNVNATALESIIETLLDFSRMHAGRLQVNLEPLDMQELVHAVTERLRSLFAQHTLVVDVEVGLDALGDRALLERVFENLLSNAASHTPAGTRVSVSARLSPKGVLVTVADSGPGIPPDELRHLGEKFFRGGHPNRRSSRGTGLGLAFVKDILRTHESELAIHSRAGEGSRFSFVLPVAHRSAGAEGRSATQYTRRAATPF